MSEQLGVLCYTTVTGGYTAASGFLNVASTGAGSGILPFPGSGTFSVVIADPVTFAPKALLKVTGINSATQFAVTNSGGVDVNCSAGDLVQAVIDARALTAIMAGDWTSLSSLYQNGWSDLGGGVQGGAYSKDGSGRVWLRGVIKGGTEAGATILWTFPAGFRPPTAIAAWPIVANNGSSYQTNSVTISTGGVVQLSFAITIGAGSLIYLDNLSFSVNA